MTLRRTTKTNGPNASPLAFKPQGGVTDRYCVKCKTWMPSKGGKQLPGTKLWVCAGEHGKPKATDTAHRGHHTKLGRQAERLIRRLTEWAG